MVINRTSQHQRRPAHPTGVKASVARGTTRRSTTSERSSRQLSSLGLHHTRRLAIHSTRTLTELHAPWFGRPNIRLRSFYNWCYIWCIISIYTLFSFIFQYAANSSSQHSSRGGGAQVRRKQFHIGTNLPSEWALLILL